jgi:hypothetical protein
MVLVQMTYWNGCDRLHSCLSGGEYIPQDGVLVNQWSWDLFRLEAEEYDGPHYWGEHDSYHDR